jgi:hypothetical protein
MALQNKVISIFDVLMLAESAGAPGSAQRQIPAAETAGMLKAANRDAPAVGVTAL